MTFTYANGETKGTPLSINSVPLPCPSNMPFSEDDLHVNTERTAGGVLVGDIIRNDLPTIGAEWEYLSNLDMVALKAAIGKNFFKPMVYFDAETNNWRTITIYKTTLTYKPKYVATDGKIEGWLDVKLSFIQR